MTAMPPLPLAPSQRLAADVRLLYGADDADACLHACAQLLEAHRRDLQQPDVERLDPEQRDPQWPASQPNSAEDGANALGGFDQRQGLLIAYPDHVRPAHGAPLRSLHAALQTPGLREFSAVHVLPFFDSDGDFGFQVIDQRQVRDALGDWNDITQLATHHALCVDLVCNHVSTASSWFTAYCEGQPAFRDFFIEFDPAFDHSQVIAAPCGENFHAYHVEGRERRLWSRYGRDQVDLNYRQWRVLVAMLDNLLFLVRRGARWIRLDAIAYAWKQSGTSCAHLPQAIALVRVFRAMLDLAASDARLIAEIDFAPACAAYFPADGSGAQHGYDYSLPPLLCHALLSGDVSVLQRHLQARPACTAAASPINLLATHDGLFLKPMDPLFDVGVADCLAQATRANGGSVIERPWQGHMRPYECAIAAPALLSQHGAPDALACARIKLALSVLWALPGVPAAYANTLLLAGNDTALMHATGVARAINRGTFAQADFDACIAAEPLIAELLAHTRHLWQTRCAHAALRPHGAFAPMAAPPGVLRFVRDDALQCIANFGQAQVQVALDDGWWRDALSGHLHRQQITLAPLQCAWLVPSAGPAWNLARPHAHSWHLPADLTHAHKSRDWNDAGAPFVLDKSYRRNHLPLVARNHADAIAHDAASDYEHGRYRAARISVVCFVPWHVLERSPAFAQFEAAMRTAPFAAKIAWDNYAIRRDRLHATVCGQLHRTHDLAQIEQLADAMSAAPAFDLHIGGPWMGRSRNLGRCYLPLLPQADALGNPLSRIQGLSGGEITGFYGLGLHQFADHLDPEEADALRAIMRRFGPRVLAQTRVDSLALIATHDDLILDSRILRHIPLRG